MMSLEDFRSELFAGASEESSFFNLSSHSLIFISCHYIFLRRQQSNTYYDISLNVSRMGCGQGYVLFRSAPILCMLSSTRRVAFRLSTDTFQHNCCCSWRFINEFAMRCLITVIRSVRFVTRSKINPWMQSLARKMRRQGVLASLLSLPRFLQRSLIHFTFRRRIQM